MKLRLKLALSFLSISVIPLLVVNLLSYSNSQRAFRQAVEAEATALAEEMGRRIDTVKQELKLQVEQLCDLPFQDMAPPKLAGTDFSQNPQVSRLMSTLPDKDVLVDSLEFSPLPPHSPQPPNPPAGNAMTVGVVPRQVGPEEKLPSILVYTSRLHRHPEKDKKASEKGALLQEESDAQGLPSIPPPPPVLPELSSLEKERIQTEIEKTKEEARIAVEKARESREATARSLSSEWCKVVSETEKKSLEHNSKQVRLLFGREFRSNVMRKGEIIGTVMAQVNPEKALSRILLHSLRHEEGIPFAVDAEGSLYTLNIADRDKLKGLPIQEVARLSVSDSPQKAELENWIVVTRNDPDSGLSFGIARPIRQALDEIRRTAARNFSYGLGIMGLALVGILPLSGRLTRNLNLLTQGAEQMALGDLNVQVPVRSRDELGRLAETFNRMVRDLRENQQYLLDQERLRKELEMCRRIQEDLLPRGPLRMGLAEVKGFSIPAREVGGDFFNYFLLRDGSIALLVGDVSGKGVPAALLMANLQATLRARLPMERDLARLAEQLDQEIASSTPPEVYLTLFMGVLDREKSELCYVNAGHNTQYLLRSSQTLERLESTGRPLGLLPGGEYEDRRVTLGEGDSLFLYTDGLVEAEDETGEEFGRTRLEEMLVEEHSLDLDHLIAKVDQSVRVHRGIREARDDATIVALRVRHS